MDNSQSSVASTVTAGIQDISALLPLLGTDQCEMHTGSALGKGYFYTCVTPISIFGSLGIVKAGFNVLVAAIIVPSWKFLGAQRLADGGFRPRGDVAQLIALDPQNSGRFLAESNLEKILEDEHIENVEDLKVDWAAGSISWNLKMIVCTFVVSFLGITPYLYIIRHRSTDDNPLFLSGWGFPIIRLLGSAIAGIVIQIILQIRILIIINNRLVFLAMDRYIKAQESQKRLDKRHIDKFHEDVPGWSSDRTSELCLWELQAFLRCNRTTNSTPPVTDSEVGTKDPSPGATVVSFDDPEHTQDNETSDPYDFSSLERYFKDTRHYHLPKLQYLPWSLAKFLKSWIYIGLHLLLVVALILSVGGYIGCFNLIQGSTHVGPILWLVFEVLLCLLRVVVWAWNPYWDDNRGIAFTISLSPQSPLVTCNIYGNELESTDEVPVVRSQSILQEIASYTGPIPALQRNDAALYYILTGSGYDNGGPGNIQKVLYIVVSAFKEQTSRLVVKQSHQKEFAFFVSKLNADLRRTVITINTRVCQDFSNEPTGPETHVLTSDSEFVEQLSHHYDAILQRIGCDNHVARKQMVFSSWALQKIEARTDLALETQPTLTQADFEYLKQGKLEQCRDDYAMRLETWIEDYLGALEKELFEQLQTTHGVINHSQLTKHQGIETNEVEYLIAEARRHMEQLVLLDTFKSWRRLIAREHSAMVKYVTNFFTTDRISDSVAKIRQRLGSEIEFRLERLSNLDNKRMHDRLNSCYESVRERVGERRYLDPKEGNRIIDLWRDRLGLDDIWNKTYCKDDDSSSLSIQETTCLGSTTSQDMVVGSVLEKYDRVMYKRLQDKERFLRSDEGRDLRNRCQARFDKWKTQLQVIASEFKMIKDPKFLPRVSFNPSGEFDLTRKYWSIAAIQQRLSLAGNLKYAIISDRLVNDLGGFENLALALRHSRVAILYFTCSFIVHSNEKSPVQEPGRDVHEHRMDSENGDDGADNDSDIDGPAELLKGPQSEEVRHVLGERTMCDIARSASSITAIHFSTKTYCVSDSVQAVIDKNIDDTFKNTGPQMVCKYEDIEITDYYRHNRPYVLFENPQRSKCTVKFYVDQQINHTLTLTHTFSSMDAEIDIKLNERSLAKNKGSRNHAVNEFQDEQITIPENRIKIRPEYNIITLKMLDRGEPDNYLLGDIVLANSKENPRVKVRILDADKLTTEPENV